jgi:acyl carrier protein
VTADEITAGEVTAGEVTAGEVAAAIAAATGDESLLAGPISAASRLEGDLYLDSLDLTALGALLRDRYGTAVDLAGYVAGLDIDQLIELSVGEVTDYVNRCRQVRRTAKRSAEQPQ